MKFINKIIIFLLIILALISIANLYLFLKYPLITKLTPIPQKIIHNVRF